MGEILVSILCITHNHGLYIREAIESFLRQKTSFQFEILVHDDCSDDDTLKTLRSLESHHPGVITVYDEERNLWNSEDYPVGGYAWGTLMPHAKGKYLAFCEGDDYWVDENKLQDQVELLEKRSELTEICHCATVIDAQTNRVIGTMGMGSFPHEIGPEEVIRYWKIPSCSVMVRKNVMEEYVADWWSRDYPVGDFPLALYHSVRGSIFYDNKAMSVYRFRVPGSYTSQTNDDAKRLVIAKRWLEMLQDLDNKTCNCWHDAFVRSALSWAQTIATQKGFKTIENTLGAEALSWSSASQIINLFLKRLLWILGYSVHSVPYYVNSDSLEFGRLFGKYEIRRRDNR